MTESLENIIGKGFYTWAGNLNICIPLVINYLLQLIIWFFSAVAGMFVLLDGNSPDEIISMTEDEIVEFLSSSIMENLPAMIILALSVFIILSLVDAYFHAGAVGMSQNATARGNTTIADMFNAGSKNFINVFMANLLIALMKMAGIIFVVPGAIVTRNYMEFIESSQFDTGILLLLVGIFIWGVYLLILNVIFAPVLYAIVIEEMGPMDGIIEGYRFFVKNKFNVFIIWLFILVISTVIAVIFYFIGNIIAFVGSEGLNIAWSFGSQLLILVTLQPLIIVWWTRLYMIRTGKNIYIDELLANPWG